MFNFTVKVFGFTGALACKISIKKLKPQEAAKS